MTIWIEIFLIFYHKNQTSSNSINLDNKKSLPAVFFQISLSKTGSLKTVREKSKKAIGIPTANYPVQIPSAEAPPVYRPYIPSPNVPE